MEQHKFDNSETRLRELVHRRHILEKKAQLRSATLSEFAAVHDQSMRSIRINAQEQFKHACERNERILKDIAGATVSSYEQLREHADSKSSVAARLREQKRRYQKALVTYQPLWKAQEMHLEEQKLHMLRKEQEEAQKRRQNWMSEEARAETLKKSLDHERRELMIQLALEEKDRIAAEMRNAQAERSRAEVEEVLALELTNFHSSALQETAASAAQRGATNAEYIQRSMTLQSRQGIPLSYNDPAVGLPDVAPLQAQKQRQFQMNHPGLSTSSSAGLIAGSSHAASSLRHRINPNGTPRVGVLHELADVAGDADVDMMNVSVDSERAEQLQEPAPASRPTRPTETDTRAAPSPQLPPKQMPAQAANKENNSGNDNTSAVRTGSLVAPVPLKAPVAATGPVQPGPGSPKSSSSTQSQSGNASLFRSPSMIHQSDSMDAGDLGGMGHSARSPELRGGNGSGSGTRGNSHPSLNITEEFSLSVPYSPAHSTPSPSKSSKSPKFNFTETDEQAGAGADLTPAAAPSAAVNITMTPMPHPHPTVQPVMEDFPSSSQQQQQQVPPTPPAPPGEPSVLQEAPPATAAVPAPVPLPARHTDSWKLIQCAMSLKQLHSRFEEMRSDSRSDLGSEEATKKLYSRCVTVLASHGSADPNSSATDEYLQAHVSVGRALNAAVNKREKELVIYGPEVVVMGFLEIVQERAYDIMPLDLFNGIVTLDKLHKFHRSSGLGAEEIFNTVVQHVRQQVDRRVFNVDEAVALYTQLFLSELLPPDAQDRGRVSRKLTQLLKEAVLNCLASGDGNSSAKASPVRPATAPDPKTPGMGSMATGGPSTSAKKNTTSTKFVSLDDDEFIVDDSPPQKPPAMKDLSVFVETPAKPEDKAKGQGQGLQSRREAPPPPAMIEEEEEFDFL